MRYERVLFVIPKCDAEWKGIRPHLGIGFLAETLKNEGILYDVIDMNLGHPFKHLKRKIDEFKPDLIGMPLISLQYLNYYTLISKLKELYPNIHIIVGGPHVTILKQTVLEECRSIDYGITYEGERPLVALCKGEIPFKEIKNLLYRNGKNGSIMYNGTGEPIWNLDQLSFPKYEKFELTRYVPEATIYSSRGCPFKCIFCPNRIISPHYRARSATHVVDEIEYWYGKGFRQFNFDDDNFNYIRERVFLICDEIEKRGMKNLFLRCANGIRADRVDRDMLKRMKEVGFHYLAFGADAGNNRMLKIVKKGETIEDIEQGIRNACELEYDVKILFVTGTPYETKEDIEDKVRIAKKYPINDVHFYNLVPYPGTELFEWVKENNYFCILPEKYLNDFSCCENTPVFETPELPVEERKKIYKYLQKVRRDIHRNAFRRMYKRFGLLSYLSSYIFASDFVMKMFYQNFTIRAMIEKIRYKKAIAPVSSNQ